MNLKFNDYLDLNKEGIFPGPKETEEQFFHRIQKLRTEIALPGTGLSPEEWRAAHQITGRIFDIQPMWVPAFYQNKKISFWEAAAVWDCDGRSVIQLRNQLAKGKWGVVKQEEVLAHEAAHAARMAFNEHRFEEMICYQTSRFSWRKRLGPLFRRPWEAALCVIFAALGCLFNFLGFFSLALIIPWLPFCFFLLRLYRDHSRFQSCLQNIQFLLKKPDRALAVVLRLTDREIVFFSKASREEILSYVQAQKTDLRWSIITNVYLNESFED